MRRLQLRTVWFFVALGITHCSFAAVAPKAAARPRVLVISIDGMRPDYVTQADAHHLKIPNLRRFLSEGTYADGVVGVVPTYTYPSHTTLMTGVSPAQHGIFNNQLFDPLGTMRGAVYTQASDIKVETLWHAAHAAGCTTASVGWPVTTGSEDIDYLMPANARFEGKAADGELIEPVPAGVHFDRPAGLRELLAPEVPAKADLSIDERRFAWMLAILRRYKPEFMTTHLGELDHAEHVSGPFSQQAIDALEMLDGEVAQLIELEMKNDPHAYVVIVSDHGFLPVEKTVNLPILFAREGLLRRGTIAQPGAWDAAVWPSGGTAAVVLHDPKDAATLNKVQALVTRIAENPQYGVARVLNREELHRRGGYPDATFLLELKPGFKFSGPAAKGEPIISTPHTGAHGFLPDRPELYASFLMTGPGVLKGRDLGVIDMRQIAPTLAEIMKLKLPSAELKAVQYSKPGLEKRLGL